MAVVTIDGYGFDIDPDSVSWSYSLNIKSIDTYGGRVVQMLACQIDSLSMQGYIRPMSPKRENARKVKRYYDVYRRQRDGSVRKVRESYMVTTYDYPDADIAQWQGMRAFERKVKNIMLGHEGSNGTGEGGRPVHLKAPILGLDLWVWLTGYSDVRYQMDMPAVRYTLNFEVDWREGDGAATFAKIKETAEAHGLDEIKDGVGWVRTKYNTPTTGWEIVKKSLEEIVDDAGTFDASHPADFFEYLAKHKEAAENKGKNKKWSNSDKKDSKFTPTSGGNILEDAIDYTKKLGAQS